MSYISDALEQLRILDENKSSQNNINSQLIVLLTHMLKCKYQPEYKHKSSWRASIWNSHKSFTNEFISIGKGTLYKNFYMKQVDLDRLYFISRVDASNETGKSLDTFPEKCEWTKEQLANSYFIHDFINTYGQDI